MVYQPAEDSFLLSEIVKNFLLNKEKNILVLDVGTGSGIQSRNCIECGISKKNILAIDINAEALKQAKILGIKTLNSNLFEKVKGKFDLIIFNPPYLPAHEFDNLEDTTGGEKGDEVIIKFIKSLKKHLSKSGTCFLLSSSFTPKNWKEIAKKDFIVRKSGEKKIFYEKLFVWKISHKTKPQ